MRGLTLVAGWQNSNKGMPLLAKLSVEKAIESTIVDLQVFDEWKQNLLTSLTRYLSDSDHNFSKMIDRI